MTDRTQTISQPPLLHHQAIALSSTNSKIALIGGVGCGKTHGLAYMAYRGAADNPGCEHGMFAPSLRLFKRVTLPTFRRVIPPDLYTWHGGDNTIEWQNGSVHYCIGVDRQPEERIVGMNLASACWDEPGASRNGDIASLIMARLRFGDPSKRFLALFTSPHGFGWLQEWCAKGVHVINASTYNNTHLDRQYIELLEAEYPPGSLAHRQEMLGQFVSRTGRVYGDVFSRVAHCTPWKPQYRADWVLTVDPGFRASGWLAWNFNQADDSWVVTDEWCFEGEATEDSARKILRSRGRPPQRIFMDTPSKSSRMHTNDVQALRDVFGAGSRPRPLGGHERSSDWRHKSVLAGLGSGALKISEALCPARIGRDERGLVHSLESLEWPAVSTRDERQAEQDPRKHIIDALEFGAAVLTPPKVSRSEDRARHLQAVS